VGVDWSLGSMAPSLLTGRCTGTGVDARNDDAAQMLVSVALSRQPTSATFLPPPLITSG
jgi:hypothetical protein